MMVYGLQELKDIWDEEIVKLQHNYQMRRIKSAAVTRNLQKLKCMTTKVRDIILGRYFTKCKLQYNLDFMKWYKYQGKGN